MYNCGGPDRSIKREDFASGRAIPKRYRNRRLGDFLKELKLTEGHSTGLPAMRKAMYQNGSPEPVFDFDEERTWFQVTLPVHVAFEQKQEVILEYLLYRSYLILLSMPFFARELFRVPDKTL